MKVWGFGFAVVGRIDRAPQWASPPKWGNTIILKYNTPQKGTLMLGDTTEEKDPPEAFKAPSRNLEEPKQRTAQGGYDQGFRV